MTIKTIAAVGSFVLGAFAAQPAAATEWIYCSDETSTVTLGLLMGSADTIAVAGIVLSHGDRVWASHTAYGPGEPVSVGGGFEDSTMMLVDLMDGEFSLLAQLRLWKAEEGTGPVVYGGTLHMPGIGAWSVNCGEGA